VATRRILVAAFVALAVGAAPALAAPSTHGAAHKAAAKPAGPPVDFSLGSPRAKVKVIEYASLSCPHCARFNEQVFPAFKAKYIDTGKVRYTLREMLTPPSELAAAGFLMARCAGPSKYFKVVDEVFRSQTRWPEADSVKPIFVEIAKNNGLTEAQLDACLSDQATLAALNARVKAAVDAGVNATPTFFVDGKKVGEGEMSLDQLDAAIAAARKPGG
jgi:protein-disulfide isomerase